jgi:hypothetical protein
LRRSFGSIPSADQPNLTEHAAVLLLDGRVLISGGRQGGTPVDQLWLYDPVGAQFERTTTLTKARTGIAAARLGDGRVLLVGGFDGNGTPTNTVEIFDPSTSAVSATSVQIAGVGGACALTLADGRAAIANGTTMSGDTAALLIFNDQIGTPAVEILDGPGRSQHACAVQGEGLVVVGGRGTASTTATYFTSGGPNRATATPFPIIDGAAFVDGTEVVAICGNAQQTAAVSLASAGGVALIGDRWRLAHARTRCTATLLRDGSLLVVGGGIDARTPKAEVLFGDGNALEVDAPLDRLAHHTATRLPGGEVLIVGGDDQPPRLYLP